MYTSIFSPTISRDKSTTTVSDVHPMNTQKNHSNCLTDVVLHPTKLETGLKTVCIQINIRYIFSQYRVRVMVFNANFNNISVSSRRSVLLVEETRIPRENH